MIALNTPLPVQVSEIFHSAKDYFSSALFEVASRKSPLDIPNIITQLELKEAFITRKGAARVTVTFAMDASLVRFVTVQDMRTLSEATVTFDVQQNYAQITSSSHTLATPE